MEKGYADLTENVSLNERGKIIYVTVTKFLA